MKSAWKVGARRALGTAAALALIGTAGASFADPPETMAPPVESGSQSAYDSGNNYSNNDYSNNDYSNNDYSNSGNAGGYDAPDYESTSYDAPSVGNASQDSVFNWREVPAEQRVPLRRAVFDRGGYQLYDAAGATIVVPFTSHNLYVMKFAPSPDGTLYFVNDGDAPVLYVPRGGYLENAAAPGARWYPFSRDFRPSQPVFIGIAPSWDEFCGMGWYPRMVFYGGYWGRHSFLTGGAFLPTIGLSIFIGGHPYYGWEPYHDYYRYHEAPYHVTIVNQNIYRFGGHDNGDRGGFRGTDRSYKSNRSFGNRSFGGRPTGPLGGRRTFDTRTSDNRSFDNRSFGGDRTAGTGRVFQGGRGFDGGRRPDNGGRPITSGSGQPYYAPHDFSGGRDFQGARSSSSSPVFQGRAPFNSGSSSGAPVFQGRSYSNSGDHGFSQRPFPGGQRPFPSSQDGNSPRAFGGGQSYSDPGRSYPAAGRPSGGDTRPADRPAPGERRYAGGQGSRSGNGGGRR